MTPWERELTPSAQRDYHHVPQRDQATIDRAIDRLCIDPGTVDIRRVQGTRDHWRLRVGIWRVRFIFDRPSHTVSVISIDQRKDAYR